MMGLRADRMLALWIENHQVGIASHGDRSLARIKSEQFCRRCRSQFYKTIHAKTPARYASRENQAHAMLNSRPSVRNLCEIVAAQFFLLFETERAMIGGNHLQMIARQSIPQFFLVPLLAEE